MYCLSVVDLLGSLLSGVNTGTTTKNAKTYVLKYMKYDPADVDVIWKRFRHKMFHLAMPDTGFKYKTQIVTWNLHNRYAKIISMLFFQQEKL